jgi:tetratricopeptide (TPR) repeat protein
MGKLHRFCATTALLGICLAAEFRSASAAAGDSVQTILAVAQQAMLDRHYRQAVNVLQRGVKDHPADNRLRLELGRAYVLAGAQHKAIRLLREVVGAEPENRSAKVELAFALSYDLQYERSNAIFRELLLVDEGDEAAAIGLASNLLHQMRIPEATNVVKRALAIHPNSLRLQEYKDRIESGKFSGEELEPELRHNLVDASADYFNDSGGNHSWGSTERVEFAIGRDLQNRIVFAQQFQHSRDDLFEALQAFSEQMRWRPREGLIVQGGGGAIRFGNADVNSIYETSVAIQPRRRFILGASFGRIPIIPNAEATEHRLTAQGWVAFGGWTRDRWQANLRATRQHYTDKNICSREFADATRTWIGGRLTFEAGYFYRRESFEKDFAHGYFSPNLYQSHLGMVGAVFRTATLYRGEGLVYAGAESVASGQSYQSAWEIDVRNELLWKNWTLELDYSKYHLVQDTGAFRADAGRFEFAYRF